MGLERIMKLDSSTAAAAARVNSMPNRPLCNLTAQQFHEEYNESSARSIE